MSLNKNKLAVAALAGLLTAGFSASPALANTHATGHDAATPEKHGDAAHEIEKHACKGHNSCKGNGGGSKKEWGKNLMEGLGEGVLDSGKSHAVSELADGTYDLRISAPDEGILCYMSNVAIAGGKVELTEDMGKACK